MLKFALNPSVVLDLMSLNRDCTVFKRFTYSICDRNHFDDEDLTDLYRKRAKIAMPDKYQDNLGCAKQYNRNEGLCPGDSGNTVGESSDFTDLLKQNYMEFIY